MSFQATLLRLVGKVSRDVESAKEAVEAVQATPVSSLRVYLKGGPACGWERRGGDCGRHWKDFQHWYHGREKSECFVMRFQTGSRMILRKEIRGYEITRWED